MTDVKMKIRNVDVNVIATREAVENDLQQLKKQLAELLAVEILPHMCFEAEWDIATQQYRLSATTKLLTGELDDTTLDSI